jgi:hypothetical protein
MKLSALKRIITEDFAKDQQDFANRLGLIINPIVDQLSNIFDKRIDFINLNRQIKTFTLKVDSNGAPINTLQIKSELKTKAAGMNVIRVSGNTVTSCPFVTFSEDGGLINISNIKGLSANQEFTLTVEIIGENTN